MIWTPAMIAWLAVLLVALVLAAWWTIRFIAVFHRLSRNVPHLPFWERAFRAAGDSATYLVAGVLAVVSSLTMAGISVSELTGYNEVKDAIVSAIPPEAQPFILFGIAILVWWARSRTKTPS